MSLNHVRPWRNIYRRKSRMVHVGNVAVGGDAPISVQTMTNTDTTDVAATVAQIQAAADVGLPAPFADTKVEGRNSGPWLLEDASEPIAMGADRFFDGLRFDPDEAVSYLEALTANLNRGWAPLRGVMRGRYKYVSLPIPELYDLEADPGEETNLVQTERRVVSELRALLPQESAWPPPRPASAWPPPT